VFSRNVTFYSLYVHFQISNLLKTTKRSKILLQVAKTYSTHETNKHDMYTLYTCSSLNVLKRHRFS